MAEKTVTQNGLVYTLSSDGSYYTVEIPSELGDDVEIENNIDGIPVIYNELNEDSHETEPVGSSGESSEEGTDDTISTTDGGLIYTLSSDGSYYSVKWDETTEIVDVVIPDYINGVPVTRIENAEYTCVSGSGGFAMSNTLKSIVLPNTLTYIGWYAFSWCSSLTSINIPDSVTSIGEGTFSGCTSLTSITIPDSVTSIEYNAFNGCESLTSITIPDGVTSIGYMAFRYCSSLTSINIPDSVTSIGSYIFEGCESLTSITVDPDNTVYKSDGNCIIEKATNKLITGCKASIIPNYVTSIESYAFYGCSSLTSITIPDSVTSIKAFAFGYCTSLTSITIPDSVTSIGGYAFSHCTALKTVILGKGLETLYGTNEWNGSFLDCTALTTVINKSDNLVTPNDTDVFYGCSNLTKVYYTSTTAGYVDGGTWCGKTLEYLNWNGEDSLMLNATADSIVLPTDSNGKTSATVKTLTSV